MGQTRQVEHELRYGQRFPVLPKSVLQPVCLGRHIVDHDDGGGLIVVGVGPPAIELVGSALVNRGLDWAAWAAERHQFRVNADAVVKRVVRAAIQQRFKGDGVGHALVSG